MLDNNISQELGSRHGAALGMSDASDAIIVVLSEETGTISLAYDGVMIRDLSIKGLQIALTERLIHKRDRVSEKSPAQTDK
jgi:diadenylate cyclase